MPVREIAEAYRNFRERCRLTAGAFSIECRDFLPENAERPSIGDEIGDHEHEQSVDAWRFEPVQTQERSLAKIEGLTGERFRPCAEVILVTAANPVDGDRQIVVNDTFDCAGGRNEIAAQNIVAGNNAIHACLDEVDVKRALRAEAAGDVESGGVRRGLMGQEHPLLADRRQRGTFPAGWWDSVNPWDSRTRLALKPLFDQPALALRQLIGCPIREFILAHVVTSGSAASRAASSSLRPAISSTIFSSTALASNATVGRWNNVCSGRSTSNSLQIRSMISMAASDVPPSSKKLL